MRSKKSCFVWCVFALLVSCVKAEDRPQPKLAVCGLLITGSNGPVPVTAEIAASEDERSKGLMWRAAVADGEGMLFVYDRDTPLAFWMKNTLVPLSIAFISSRGEILSIHDMDPGNTRSVRSERSCRYALEVPQGWFTRMGIQTGSLVTGLPD
jgi:uncharacterized membrane protein (UPF0127 family)